MKTIDEIKEILTPEYRQYTVGMERNAFLEGASLIFRKLSDAMAETEKPIFVWQESRLKKPKNGKHIIAMSRGNMWFDMYNSHSPNFDYWMYAPETI